MLSRNGRNSADGTFDWRDAVCDAGIAAAVTFFSSLSGMGLAEVNGVKALTAACVAAGAQFFAFLALKRGLVKK